MNISLYLKKIKTAWLCYQKILRIFEVSEIDNFVTMCIIYGFNKHVQVLGS